MKGLSNAEMLLLGRYKTQYICFNWPKDITKCKLSTSAQHKLQSQNGNNMVSNTSFARRKISSLHIGWHFFPSTPFIKTIACKNIWIFSVSRDSFSKLVTSCGILSFPLGHYHSCPKKGSFIQLARGQSTESWGASPWLKLQNCHYFNSLPVIMSNSSTQKRNP